MLLWENIQSTQNRTISISMSKDKYYGTGLQSQPIETPSLRGRLHFNLLLTLN